MDEEGNGLVPAADARVIETLCADPQSVDPSGTLGSAWGVTAEVAGRPGAGASTR